MANKPKKRSSMTLDFTAIKGMRRHPRSKEDLELREFGIEFTDGPARDELEAMRSAAEDLLELVPLLRRVAADKHELLEKITKEIADECSDAVLDQLDGKSEGWEDKGVRFGIVESTPDDVTIEVDLCLSESGPSYRASLSALVESCCEIDPNDYDNNSHLRKALGGLRGALAKCERMVSDRIDALEAEEITGRS